MWSKIHYNNVNSGFYNHTVPFANANNFNSWSFDAKAPIYSSPVLANDNHTNSTTFVFFLSSNYVLYALNSSNLLWNFSLTNAKSYEKNGQATPTYSNGVVYVGDNNAYIYALSVSGSLEWSKKIGVNPFYSSPAIFNNYIYISATLSSVYQIHMNGTLFKEQSLGTQCSGTISFDSEGNLYILCFTKLFALSSTLSERWSSPEKINGEFVFFHGSAAIGKSGLFVSSTKGLLHYDFSGNLKWRLQEYEETYYSTPSIGPDETIYLGSSGSFENRTKLVEFKAINHTNGNVIWRFNDTTPVSWETGDYPTDKNFFDNSPAISANGTIYCGSVRFYCLNSSGSLLWKFDLMGLNVRSTNSLSYFASSPAIGPDGEVYVGASGNSILYAINGVQGFVSSESKSKKSNSLMVVEIVVPIFSVLLFTVVARLFYLNYRNKKRLEDARRKDFESDKGEFNQGIVLSDRGDRDGIEWKNISLNGYSENLILGRGSYGTVIRGKWNIDAKNGLVGVDVAVKVLMDSNFERVEREVNILKLAQKKIVSDCLIRVYGVVKGKVTPAVASLFSASSDVEYCGIVMRFEGGGSLENLLHPKVGGKLPLSLAEKLRLVTDIVAGLAELHVVGIVHGDLKPSNILLSNRNPPDIRIADFGLSRLMDDAALSNQSTLQLTSVSRGTPLYCAPEMLVNPFGDSELVSRSSRKTDIYAFALLAWEIFCRQKPFTGIKSEISLSTQLQNGLRPSFDLLPIELQGKSIETMISSCWSGKRGDRLSAAECFSIISHYNLIFGAKKHDIFFSHSWLSKPFVSHIYRHLVGIGYRVWYDQVEMGYDLKASMKNGIENSSVVVVCLNSTYQTRENCMFELREAAVNCNPPKKIITIFIEGNHDEWVNAEVKELCKLNERDNVDFSHLVNLFEDDGGESGVVDVKELLNQEIQPLISLLLKNQCGPSL